MSLGQLQEEFSVKFARLVLYAHQHGYGVRTKHVMRCRNCRVGKAKSVHKDSLAADIRLTKEGKLVENVNDNWEADYNFLHDLWDKLGGAPRIANDLGHFSFKYQGRW